MIENFTLARSHVAALLIDVQEKLFERVERAPAVLQTMQKAIQGLQILQVPLFVTEQYPQGLGPTVSALKSSLPAAQEYWSKITFSCLGDPTIRGALLSQPFEQWILMGIEAHVCVLQTAKELLQAKRQVVVLRDATSSRFPQDFATAIAELRDIGVRVSSTETILFELLREASGTEFKQISALIR